VPQFLARSHDDERHEIDPVADQFASNVSQSLSSSDRGSGNWNPWPERRRRACRGARLLVAACAFLTGPCGCTHFTPYYRWDQAHQVAPIDGAEIDHRLLLIGDAGDPDRAGEPTLKLLAQRVRQMPERTTVVFLGDNAYERGMPEPVEKPAEKAADVAKEVVDTVFLDLFDSRQQAERALNAQLDVVRGTPARVIFIPGNHDWDQFEVGGWSRIREEEKFIKTSAADGGMDGTMLPPGGCPDPTPVALGTRGELIVLDTEWWLDTRIDGKPTTENNPTHCVYTTERQVRDALVAQLEAASNQHRWSIVAGHHPLESEGPHGGFVDPLTHIFPFQIVRHYVPFYIEWIPVPVLGSLVVGLRNCCSPSVQDMSNRRNRHMRNAVGLSLLEAQRHGAAPLAYAAGHDHSLQVFEASQGARYLLVSGLGSHSRASDVGSSRRTLFAHSNSAHPGFMEIDFLTDGSVRLAVLEWTDDTSDGAEVFSSYLAKPGALQKDTVAAGGGR